MVVGLAELQGEFNGKEIINGEKSLGMNDGLTHKMYFNMPSKVEAARNEHSQVRRLPPLGVCLASFISGAAVFLSSVHSLCIIIGILCSSPRPLCFGCRVARSMGSIAPGRRRPVALGCVAAENKLKKL